MPNDSQKKCLVVLGMHRSGTSALAGVLHLLGVDLGQDLMMPVEGNNSKGFFENNQITYNINDALLESLYSSWDDQFPLPEHWWQQENLSIHKHNAIETLQSEFKTSEFFAIKDPRMCLLLPFWQQIFQELHINPFYLIIVRNPLEIAASLARRDGFSVEKSVILWMNSMLNAESHSRNHSRVFISFDDLLKNTSKTITFISEALSLNFPENFQDIEYRINEFLSPNLKHHNIEDKPVNKRLLSFMSKYDAILQSFVNNPAIPKKELRKIDRVRNSYYHEATWFYNEDFQDTVKTLKEKEHVLHEKEEEILQLRPRYYAQLYVDTGAGFYEEQSIIQQITGIETQLEFELSDYNNIIGLRFDPVNSRTVLRLGQIKILTANNILHSEVTYQTNALYQKNDLLIFETHDPIITIDTIEIIKPKTVVIRLNYISWGPETYKYISEEKSSIIKIKDEQLFCQAEALEVKDAELHRQVEALEVKDAELHRQAEALQGKDAELHRQAEALQVKDTELHRQAEALQGKDAELQQKIQRIQEMEKTFTWKVAMLLGAIIHCDFLTDSQYYAQETLTGKALRLGARKLWSKRLIRNSGLFDKNYYLENNPEVVEAGVEPLRHFIKHGGFEGRKPCAEFDSAYYLARYPDVKQSGINPLVHYLLYGGFQGRMPNPNFDSKYYFEDNPDVKIANINPLYHYMMYGKEEGRLIYQETSHRTLCEYTKDNKDESESETFPQLRDIPVKLIAFYLPQFHPIAENDQWWGKGFTEWTNVTKARPLFKGHYQPRLPGELGFYDLRIPDVMKRQIELAKQYGIYGFCFYHYWFAGKRLLEHPINQFLAHPEFDFPFCLCWANENWTRRWDGQDEDILIAQEHSPEDDMAFIRHLERYLRDPRYIRIDGKPLIVVYKPSLLPDAKATVQRWRKYCKTSDIGNILVAMAQTFMAKDPRPFGFDAAVEFQPNTGAERGLWQDITGEVTFFDDNCAATVLNYDNAFSFNSRPHPEYLLFKGIMPGWDNTGRRARNGVLFANSSPQAYQQWLEKILTYTTMHHAPEHQFIFINAWNEWAEGAYLEPDRRYGYAYLNATARALCKTSLEKAQKQKVLFISHDAARAGAQILFLHLLRWIKEKTAIELKILLCEGGALEGKFKEISDVLILNEIVEHVRNIDDVEKYIREFCGKNLRLIYANSVTSGKYFKYFKNLNVPIITHVHELQKSIENFAGNTAMANVIQHTNTYIAVSRAVARNLIAKHHISQENIEIVYEFVAPPPPAILKSNKQSLREQLGLDRDKILIFGCGSMDWRKGPDIFVNVAEQLLARGLKHFRFYWIGVRIPGEYPGIEQDILKRGLQDYVTFLGERENPQQYFMAGDIFLLPSREDPFPLVCLEAATCGLPIVCFADAGGMPDFVEDDAGFVVPFQDIEQMVEKLALLIMNKEMRMSRGDRAKEKFLARHTIDNSAPEILRIIRDAASIKPFVSVIVPSYNHVPFLKKRLDSIFTQTFQDFEVILLDDCSPDGSISILQEYANRPNVRMQINTENHGVFHQWLTGIRLATAEIIWIAEDDDYCEPDLLKILTPFFEDPDIKLAYCNSHAVIEEENILWDFYLKQYYKNLPAQKWHQNYKNSGTIEVNHGLAIKNTIPNVSAVLFRKPSDLQNLEQEIREHRCTGDWIFYLYLLHNGSIGHSQKALNYHRRHGNSIVARSAKLPEHTIPDYYQVHKYVLMHYDIQPEVFEKMVEYVCRDIRTMFPDLTDEEFITMYNYQELRRLYDERNLLQ